MHNSDANKLLNCALDSLWCFYIAGPKISFFFRTSHIKKHRLRIQACFIFKLLLLTSRPPQTMGNFLENSIAGRESLCVSGKLVLCQNTLTLQCSSQYSIWNLVILSYIYIIIFEVEWWINDGRGEHFKYSGRFPTELPKVEIQSWRRIR